jgi:hypothetical protein
VTVFRLLLAVALLGSASVRANPPGSPDGIDLHDLPGSGGEWQEGDTLIDAPRERVQFWLTDYAHWSERFPDIEWQEVQADDTNGRHVIRFRSKIADCVLTVHEAVEPGLLVFYGTAKNLYTQGRIYLVPVGEKTRVMMQSTSEVHGFWRIFASQKYRRKSAYEVTTSHLNALHTLARGSRQSTAR